MAFSVCYIDPPWEFANRKTGGSFVSGASQVYPTMPLAQIQTLPIPAVLAPNATVFLWVPSRLKFSHGATCLHAWGLHYEATAYWKKQRLGMGFWIRNMAEELLIATRGDVLIDFDSVDELLIATKGSVAPWRCQRPNWIEAPAGEHSEKPDEFRRLIHDMTGSPSSRRNLEVFARKMTPGWTAIGNAITGRDIREDLRILALAA